MKVNFKTLEQKSFQLDLDEATTIGEVKERIAKEYGHAVELQKIIFAGKILGAEKKVAEIGIKNEKDFCVLMVSKVKVPKPTPAPTPAPAAAAAATSTAAPAVSGAAPTTALAPSETHSGPTPAAGAVPTSSQQPSATTTTDATPAAPAGQTLGATPATTEASASPAVPSVGSSDPSFVTGTALNTTIANLMEMGFPRDQVTRALRASFNNPDRAVEYLFNGIPAHLERSQPQTAPVGQTTAVPPSSATPASTAPAPTPAAAPAAAPTQQAPAPASTATDAPLNLFEAAAQRASAQQQQQQQQQAGMGLGAGLSGLGSGAPPTSEQSEALRNLSQSPQFAQLRTLVQQNPALLQPLLQQIGQSNPDLLQAISSDPQGFMDILGLDEEGLEGMTDDDGMGGPGSTQIQVTPTEMEAITRLEQLGFSRQIALEAFLACDRNEELAANYLFDHGADDMGD